MSAMRRHIYACHGDWKIDTRPLSCCTCTSLVLCCLFVVLTVCVWETSVIQNINYGLVYLPNQPMDGGQVTSHMIHPGHMITSHCLANLNHHLTDMCPTEFHYCSIQSNKLANLSNYTHKDGGQNIRTGNPYIH